MNAVIKKPSAWLPIAMSLAALCLVAGFLILAGPSENPASDEGIPARIFQLLLVAQLPLIAYFAIKWFHKKPKETAVILTLQILAILFALTPVFILEM